MAVSPSVVPDVTVVASSTSICAGQNVTFTATPTNGGASPTYQWLKNGAPRANDTLSTLTLAGVKLSDSGKYSCSVKNACGQIESAAAKLTVTPPPAGAALALSASVADFGCTKVKTTQEKTLTNIVFNGGGLPLNVTDMAVSGADRQDFTIVSGGGAFTLAPNEKRTITLKFVPGSKGGKSATLEFTSNSTVASPKLQLMGKGCLGEMRSTATLEMDSTIVGASSKVKELKICNTGDFALQIVNAGLKGQNTSSFSIPQSNLENVNLPPGDCITLVVTFIPTFVGIHSSEYVVITQEGDTVRFPIQGRGIESVGVEESAVSPLMVRVYPNPSSGAVSFAGSASAALPVNMRIFDLVGNQVTTETRLAGDSGEFRFEWNSSGTDNTPSGNYLAVFSFGTSQLRIPFVIQR